MYDGWFSPKILADENDLMLAECVLLALLALSGNVGC